MKTAIIITAIISLVVLECFALFMGINGTVLRMVVIAIGILAGIVIPTPKIFKGN